MVQRETPASGFTLVEVLVALVLLALLGGMMAAFLNQLRPLTTLQARTTAEAELGSVIRYMETTLAGAMALPLVTVDPGDQSFLRGGATEVQFVAPTRQGTYSYALRETSLRLSEADGQRNLVQSFFPRRIGQAEEMETSTVILLYDVETIRFTYLDRNEVTAAPIWVDAWDRPATLPFAVRIEIVLQRQSQPLQKEGIALLELAEP